MAKITKGSFSRDQKVYWERSELLGRRHPEHPVIKEYVLPKIELISRYVKLSKTTRLLDVGCGNGYFTFYFDAICDASGVDYSETMLALNPVRNKQLMDAANLQFNDDSFDVVFCHALLHHVKNIDRVVFEMRRVSRKYIVILEPNILNPFMFLFSALKKEERGALRFTLSNLRRILQYNGLTLIVSFSYGMIVPNKTPLFLLPIVKRLGVRHPFGMTNFLIAHK